MLGSITGLQSYNTHQSIGKQVEQLDTSEAVNESNVDESPISEDFSLSNRRYSYVHIAQQFDVEALPSKDLMGFRSELFKFNLIGFPEANVITMATQGQSEPINLPQALQNFFDDQNNAKYLPLKDQLNSTVGNLTAAREEFSKNAS